MSIRQLLSAAGLACLFAAWPAGAQPTTATPISLTQALQAARNNSDVLLARRSLAAAQADIQSADHAPAPVLSLKAASIDLQNGIGPGNVLSRKRIDKAIGVDWTWERGDKRALRTRAAQRFAAAAEADVDETLVLQQLAASDAYFELLSAQERIAQVEELAQSAAQLAGAAARRVKAGDMSAQDAARTDIEAQRARSDLLGARLDRQRAALALAQLTGFNGPGMLQADPAWPPLGGADTGPYPLVEDRADVRAAAQRVEAAQAALDVASAQKKADITLGTSFDHYPGTSNRLLEFRAQIPLQGVFGSYNFQGEIARALAELDAAQDALDKTRRAATADLQRLQQEREGAAARALGYETTIVPGARKAAEMAELAFNKGAMSLTELIDARRTLRAILIEDLAARTDHAKALQAWQLRRP
ncbi:MAG: TolC family protein [Comamonadaceae bacterium]|nr:MAG: TolC family protein [Comamonadaceae bacterium]